MNPLHVVATIPGAIALPGGPAAFDSLLARVVAMHEGRSMIEEDFAAAGPLEIPVEREPAGRFHLASFSEGRFVQHEGRWINRRFPVPEAVHLGAENVRRVNVSAGAQKSYRIPMEVGFLADSRLTWWCIGDADPIRALLAAVGYVGKKRGTGNGRVTRWTVEPCEIWPGFPIVRDGLPLRPLPPDWLGLALGVETAYRTLTFPYYQNARRELVAVPKGMG